MSNKLNCACYAALCGAWLCSTVAFADTGVDRFTSESVGIKSPPSKREVRTQIAIAPIISESTIAVQGDIFAGFAPRIMCRDLEQYLEREPRHSDPFACVLKPGKEPSTYEVWQPEYTYVTESFMNDPWADYLAGKGPRPIKLSDEAEALAEREYLARLRTSLVDYDDGGVDQSPFFSEYGTDFFSRRAYQRRFESWTGGDAFSSGRFTARQGARRANRWSRPASPIPIGSFVATKGMSGQAKNLPEPRWPNSNLPLRVYISSAVAAARGGLVSHEIKSALREWREASNGRVLYVLTDQYVEADIVFVCEMTSDHQWAENVTDYHNSNYDRVRVRLLDDTLLKLDPKRVRGLCLHEVGHAFGIRNHSNDKHDAMSLAATDDFHPVLALSSNDRKLIAKLYP